MLCSHVSEYHGPHDGIDQPDLVTPEGRDEFSHLLERMHVDVPGDPQAPIHSGSTGVARASLEIHRAYRRPTCGSSPFSEEQVPRVESPSTSNQTAGFTQ